MRLAYDPATDRLFTSLGYYGVPPFLPGPCDCEGDVEELDTNGDVLRSIPPSFGNECGRMDSIAVTDASIYTTDDETNRLCQFDKVSLAPVSSAIPPGAGGYTEDEGRKTYYDHLANLATDPYNHLYLALRLQAGPTCSTDCAAGHVVRELQGNSYTDHHVANPLDVASNGSSTFALAEREGCCGNRILEIGSNVELEPEPPAEQISAIGNDYANHILAVGRAAGKAALWEFDASTDQEVGYCPVDPLRSGCGRENEAGTYNSLNLEYEEIVSSVTQILDVAADRSGHVYLLVERAQHAGANPLFVLWKLGPPLDTDGDGVPNREDWCPRGAGPAPHGCRKVTTSVSLRYLKSKGQFTGTVAAAMVECRSDVRVKIVGPYGQVGKGWTSESGDFVVKPNSHKPGRYVAHVESHSSAEAECQGSHSPSIQVGRRPKKHRRSHHRRHHRQRFSALSALPPTGGSEQLLEVPGHRHR